jgi:hypothetical protein
VLVSLRYGHFSSFEEKETNPPNERKRMKGSVKRGRAQEFTPSTPQRKSVLAKPKCAISRSPRSGLVIFPVANTAGQHAIERQQSLA